ncbi:two-component system sensor histidine kinase ArlS [Neobacillus niacini]|uniref:sensor histidine kinase n=1 Tax=Neobacillus niacini TaxID=86668 RepID=UPI00277EDAD6|nr:HAMP domain-containing sensor histidine kinase [Neobacillus niacini]MDQ1004065.1 two-component system sensor histidine kinase ArlS [Neobacillus niacini]
MKISIKLGLWFSVCILLIEIVSMTFLHRNLVHSRVHQEFELLQATGNSQRDILEINSDSHTLSHIKLLGAHSDTQVVVTNTKGEIILTSVKINSSINDILKIPISNSNLPRNGKIIQSDWKSEKYIATVTAFNKNGKESGYVYMFKYTTNVQKLISQLNKHLFVASLLILFSVLIFIFFLSKALTKPLITMKEATKKLSKGDFTVTLPKPSNDELGELSHSIQTLANDLNYLKQERNEFLASISHELRTPLTYINGYADIARRTNLNENDRVQYLEIIKEESQRVSSLLKELFDLAKLDQNAFSIKKEQVNFFSYFHSIYERVLPAFKNKGIQLMFDCPDNIFINIDPVRFEQVLINLLDNCLKYSKESSTTSISAIEENGIIQITIKDQGVGIPVEDLPHIFDRLYRVDKSRSRATGGFGLGLAIVKQLVESHGGEITVKSQVGEGTCFTIILKR